MLRRCIVMGLKSVASLICTVLLVSIVGAVPYNSESSHLDNAFSMQAGQTCPLSGACEVCQSAQIGSSNFHVCPDDGDSCNPKLCYYSSVCRCPPSLLQSPLLKCNSTTTIRVEGKTVKVTHNILITPGTNVPDEVCFVTEPFIDSCSQECNLTCSLVDRVCVNQTLTGDLSTCDPDACQCLPNYLPPDCCKCDTNNYYLPNCDRYCRDNCASFRPPESGGCITCRRPGFEPPACCDCESGKTNIDGTCKCSGNINDDGSCKIGYAPDDCCTCAPGYRNVSGICEPDACLNNTITGDGSSCSTTGCQCKPGYAPADCCNCAPDFYKNANGECIPFCPGNTINGDATSCSTTGCQCKAGYAPADCCNCAPSYYKNANGECKQFCPGNTINGDATSCSTTGCQCKAGYAPADCCNCDPDFYKNANGECKPFCPGNTINGDATSCSTTGCQCKAGYAPADCCNCAPSYYKNANGECISFCAENTINGDATSCNTNGCQCKNGYAPTDCCECDSGFTKNSDGKCEPSCSINQNIYFLLDGTKGNNEFCSMAIIIQMLVAAFNPTASLSGTRVSTVLFPNGQHLNASVVFGTQDTCDTIVNSKIRELQQEFQKCRTPGTNYVPLYPSFCGEGTSAVDGLKTIYELIPSPPTTNSAVVILTDGQILDDATERNNILDKFGERGVTSILAAAVKGSGSLSATVDNLRLYTLQNKEEDAILRDNVIDVGVGIVARMKETGLICPEHAANVTRALQAAQDDTFLIDNFCRCHSDPPPSVNGLVCRVGYPECGGPLSISYEYVPQTESANLEEEILAAVEAVLEKIEG